MPAIRRVRGRVLRLARRRALSTTIGVALAAPAAWVEFSGRDFPWWVNGLGLIAVATGAALIWTGLSGVRPDWIEE